jgi:adenylate cyclase class 2
VTGGAPGRREEIEIKLPAADLAPVRNRLGELGARRRTERHDESNDLYDDPERKLSGSGRTVRLRRAAGKSVLTYKGASRFEEGTRVREEREVEVSDAAEAEGILAGLGLKKSFRYEKRREEWDAEGCVVALDETPIGDFVEIEGDPSAIRKLVSALALDAAAAIPYSYAELYLRLRKEDPSLPPDMVFARKPD